MKELIKPLPIEADYEKRDVDFFTESTCRGGNTRTCNKVCGEGSTNNSISETENILF